MVAEGEVEVLEPSANTLCGFGHGFPSAASALPSETLEALHCVRRFKQKPWHKAPFCGRRLTVSPRSQFAQGSTRAAADVIFTAVQRSSRAATSAGNRPVAIGPQLVGMIRISDLF